MRKKIGITAIILILFLIGILLLLGRKIEPREWMNLKEEEFAIIWNMTLQEEKGRVLGEERYVSLDYVAKNWNQRFYLEENGTVRYILPEEVMVLTAGEMSYQLGAEVCETKVPVLITEGEDSWIALSLVAEYTDLCLTNTEDAAIIWLDGPKQRSVDVLKKKTKLRIGAGIFQRKLADLSEGTEVFIAEEGRYWTKIMTKDGLPGYVKNGSLSGNLRQEEIFSGFSHPEYTSVSFPEEVILGWNYIADAPYGLDALKQCLEKNPKINVVAPTWFLLNDDMGGFDSHADPAYVEYAKKKGLMIWAMVENLSYDVDSHAVLTDLTSRKRLIEGLMTAAEEYGLDGINVDFEALSKETGPAYLQFIRELSMECRIRGLVLSVDNYVPKPWTSFYDREEQGKIVDYVIVMGYDEHYGGGPTAGPTASIAFVEEGIQETLKVVPKEKVINAIPFYSRLWATTPAAQSDGKGVKIEDKDLGTCYLTSTTKSMEECREIKMMIPSEWLEDVGQNYIRYTEDGVRYEIWLEDETSMKVRMDMIRKYDLAGIACWRLGLETEDVWDIIVN